MVNARPQQVPPWLREEYPFETHRFQTPAGAMMSHLDEGPRGDEAVLMLHGNPTWSFFYRNVVKALAPGMRCIVPDHVGMGLSEKPQNYDYRLVTRINDITSLVASLGLKKVHLIVHDWGGAIGFGFATANPSLIGRITVLNTAAFYSDHIPRRISLCRAGWPGRLLVRGLNGFAGPATWMSTVRPLPRLIKKGFLLPYDSWANRVAVHAFVKDIPMSKRHATRPVLDGIEQRLHLLSGHEKQILWGGRDFCFNDHFLKRWLTLYPGIASHRYADAGHYLLEDAGVDAIRRIQRFFQP